MKSLGRRRLELAGFRDGGLSIPPFFFFCVI